jgi:hypothetical protein
MRSILQTMNTERPAAVATGSFQARSFLTSDFRASGRFFTPNAPVVIAELSVPIGVTLSLLPDRRCQIYLKAKHEVTMAGGTPAGAYAIDLGAQGLDIVKSQRPAPALPAKSHPDAHALAFNGNTPMGEVDVTAINYDTNVVTVDRPAGATKIVLYFLTGSGELILRGVRPTGSDQASPQLVRYSFRSLHETNQADDLSAVTFDDLKELPNRWKVAVEVISPVNIAFEPEARHLLTLPGGYTATKVLDASRFDALAEVALRGGRL